ncbi:hypothetical protein DSLASN_08510 [Desulfoluna limicola]|uniref:DUF1638 domain-containing protein n=1 Tax=Desulfoluna limicola TaxID=2810562 RepID=A0ABM7PDI3_9BACT|nr:DUF1638 domain-containing protein [Desulfoluna limicola]BCS95219.1 hypothetical protein DSLASN_08510 [Desulfoluna limicola]
MHYAIIACEVMRPELEFLSNAVAYSPEIHYLRQGLHDTPKRLKQEVQGMIEAVETESPHLTHLVLAYGLCGQGMTGITARRCELIIPRVHDCIPLLIGSRAIHKREHEKACGTYWFSPGWLTHSVIPYLDNRSVRLTNYIEKYGKDQADTLMGMEDAVLTNYTRACLISWPGFDATWLPMAHEAAERSNLHLETLPGNPSYIQELLQGPWNPRRFARIVPGHEITQSLDEEVVICGEPLAVCPA